MVKRGGGWSRSPSFLNTAPGTGPSVLSECTGPGFTEASLWSLPPLGAEGSFLPAELIFAFSMKELGSDVVVATHDLCTDLSWPLSPHLWEAWDSISEAASQEGPPCKLHMTPRHSVPSLWPQEPVPSDGRTGVVASWRSPKACSQETLGVAIWQADLEISATNCPHHQWSSGSPSACDGCGEQQAVIMLTSLKLELTQPLSLLVVHAHMQTH